jgi:DNA-binding MarR family transcriptional regulator
MSKPQKRSALYRLIEAGRVARLAVARPLAGLGLEPGDDAVLFLLGERRGLVDAEIGEALGLDVAALAPFIQRLLDRGMVARRAIGPDLELGLVLTEYGETVRRRIAAHWSSLEDSLFEGLPGRKRRMFRRTLKLLAVRLSAGSAERRPDHPPIDEGDGGDDDQGKDDQAQ